MKKMIKLSDIFMCGSFEPERIHEDYRVFIVPKGITDTDQLLILFEQGLDFPYFGHNWNALSDCLRDLDWITEHNVVIIHKDIPNLIECDLKSYLSVLRDSMYDWLRSYEHKLLIIFPKEMENIPVEA